MVLLSHNAKWSLANLKYTPVCAHLERVLATRQWSVATTGDQVAFSTFVY